MDSRPISVLDLQSGEIVRQRVDILFSFILEWLIYEKGHADAQGK